MRKIARGVDVEAARSLPLSSLTHFGRFLINHLVRTKRLAAMTDHAWPNSRTPLLANAGPCTYCP